MNRDKTVSTRITTQGYEDLQEQLEDDRIESLSHLTRDYDAYLRNPDAFNVVVSILGSQEIEAEELIAEKDPGRELRQLESGLGEEVGYLQDFRLAFDEIHKYGIRGQNNAAEEVLDAFYESGRDYEPFLERTVELYSSINK